MTDSHTTTTHPRRDLAAVLDGLPAPARIARDTEVVLAAVGAALPGADLAPARRAAAAAVHADRRAVPAELIGGLRAEAGPDEATGAPSGIGYDTGSFADVADWIERALDRNGERP